MTSGMSLGLEVRVEGYEDVTAALGKLVPIIVEKALKRFAEEIKIRAIPYPPEGSYNRPAPYPHKWYQRLFGPRWMTKAGEWRGSNTSEQLQKSWVVEPKGKDAYIVGNRASYSHWVMGAEQTAIHAAHGWIRLDELAVKYAKLWYDILAEEVQKALGGV